MILGFLPAVDMDVPLMDFLRFAGALWYFMPILAEIKAKGQPRISDH
jgi:hypothetical protein